MCSQYGIGRGSKDKISIFQTHNQTHFQSDQGEKMRSFTFVIQKLIERPLLFNQRKFDIRMWVLINSSDGRCYLYREGYVRTSSKIYTDYDPALSSDEQIYM